jgi:hypothetical protein
MRRLLTRIQRLVFVHEAGVGASGALGQCVRIPAADSVCVLCEITHSKLGPKWEWMRFRDELRVPVLAAYRETAGAAVSEVCRDYPFVVAVSGERHDLLLDSTALAACDGSVEALRKEVTRSARRRGLGFW